MKKILIVLTGMYYGGMERVSFITRDILLESNYKVDFVTLFTGDPDYKPGFKYVSLNCEIRKSKIGKIFVTFQRIHRMKKYKRKTKPDCVLTFGKSPAFSNIMSKGNEKIFVGIRSYDWLEEHNYGFLLEKYMYRKADKVISVSKLIQSDAENTFNLEKRKSFYLYNPYDCEMINNRALEKIDEFDIPTEKKIIVSVGRLEDQKGFYHLVKALSLLSEESKKGIKAYILGHGGKNGALKKLINALGLKNTIVLTGGQDNPYKFMKRADLYVMPSISEGFPNALVEAMAVGTPVLSADCKSGPREILSNDNIYKQAKGIEFAEYGILVRPMSDSKNYDAGCIEKCDRNLSSAIEKVLFNDDLLKDYGNRAKNRAKDFSYDSFKKKLLSIIES